MSVPRRSPLFLVVALILCSTQTIEAEPYLAVREGLKCSACHVNRTGQGKRNAFGVSFSQTKLPALVTPAAQRADIINRNISEFFSVGADFRLQNNTTLPYTKSGRKSVTQNTFLIQEGNVYAELTLIKDRLTFYLDEQVAPFVANREMVGILRGLPNNAYVKVGRLFLPYGLRLWDPDAFIRSRTGFPAFGAPGLIEPDIGGEVGIEPGALSLSVALSNGEVAARSDDSNKGKQFSLTIAGVTPHARIGGSLAANARDPAFPGKARMMGGPFIGLTGGPVTLLGEVDAVKTYVPSGLTLKKATQTAAYGELNVLLARGVNAKVAYDYFDPKGGGVKEKRFRIGFEPVINQFLQARVFYATFRPRTVPPPGGTGNGDQLTLELHMLF